MTIPQLLAEKKHLEKRRDRLAAQLGDVRAQLRSVTERLETLQQRERLAALIGVPAGVKIGYRVATHEPHAWVNDARGTLVTMRRTRGTVDYGERGKFNVRLSDLVPADESQGVTFAALVSGDMPDAPDYAEA